MADMIARTFELDDFDIKRDRSGRTVTAYAAVFNEDAEIRDGHGHYIERINAKAFNRAVSHGISRIGVFYNHGYDLSGKPNMLGAVPIASPVEVRPDGRGLLTISRYNDGELADAVLAAWEGGQIRGQSFRGAVYNSKNHGSNGRLKVIERTELGLREYGPTHSPAYEGAGLVAIRSTHDLEELVRSMISELVGTPKASPAGSDTSDPEPVTTGDSSAVAEHSSRNRILARRNSQRARAISLGVIRSEAS